MVGNDFYFDGHWLSEFGMRVYDPYDSQQFVSREIDKADITPLRPVPNHYSAHYSDALTLSFLVVRDEEDEFLTKDSENFHRHMGYTLAGTFHNCGLKFGRLYNMIWMEKILR